MKHLAASAAVSAVLAVTAACGGGEEAAADRTVEVDMVDIAFRPDTVDVERGETVRFVFTNEGDVEHEGYVGDRQAQLDHAEEMAAAEADGGHGHGGATEDSVTVAPGDTGELVHTFDEAGTLEIGCHVPGHYEAGMKIAVEVT